MDGDSSETSPPTIGVGHIDDFSRIIYLRNFRQKNSQYTAREENLTS